MPYGISDRECFSQYLKLYLCNRLVHIDAVTPFTNRGSLVVLQLMSRHREAQLLDCIAKPVLLSSL